MKKPSPKGGQSVFVRRDAANRICLTIPAGIGSSRVSAKICLYMVRRRRPDGILRRLACWRARRRRQRLGAVYRARDATP